MFTSIDKALVAAIMGILSIVNLLWGVDLFGWGVHTERFRPARRDERLRAELAPDGEVIVGYVGRLAIEKRVDLLNASRPLPAIQLFP